MKGNNNKNKIKITQIISLPPKPWHWWEEESKNNENHY
jgi:hypothetical protein